MTQSSWSQATMPRNFRNSSKSLGNNFTNNHLKYKFTKYIVFPKCVIIELSLWIFNKIIQKNESKSIQKDNNKI